MHYVYILKSKLDGRLYIGSTADLKRRLAEHSSGKDTSTKYRLPLELVYYEAFKSKMDSLRREKNLKKFRNSYSQLKNRINNSLSA